MKLSGATCRNLLTASCKCKEVICMKLSGATCRNLLTASCKCKEVIIQQLLRCMSFSKSNHQASLSQVVKGTEFPDTSQTAS